MELKHGKDYGVYRLSDRKYQAYFWDILKGKNIYLKGCVTEEGANQVYANYQFEFYSKNPFLIPKGISIDRHAKRFKYVLRNGQEVLMTRNFKTIQMCLKFRDSIIKGMI